MGPWEALVIITAIIAFVVVIFIASSTELAEPKERVVPEPRNYWEIQKKIYPCSHVKMLGDTLVGVCDLENGHEGEHNMTFRNLSNGAKHDEDLP